MTDKNPAETIAALAREADRGIVQINYDDGRSFIVRPNNSVLDEITHPNARPQPVPQFVGQTVYVQTADSLIAYVNRFKTADTMLFANLEDDGSIVAVIDYHKPDPVKAKADFTKHRAVFDLGLSHEYEVWSTNDDVWFKQAKFARFLTENSMDIVLPPGGSNLHELVLDLEGEANLRVVKRMRSAHSGQGASGSQVEKRINSATGEGLPAEFTVRIPIFTGEPAVDIRTFFKDEVTDGGIMLGYQLSRLEQIKQAEIQRICERIAAHTGIDMIIGKIT